MPSSEHAYARTDLPAVANRAVRLGRRATAARLPEPLEPLRSAAKKVAWTVVEARLVDKPLRYAARELVHPTTADYRLRRGGGHLSLRHRTGDVDIFRKFYAYGWYEMPHQLEARLKNLGRPIRVLDLGANIGLFEVFNQQRLPIGSVVAFEPEPDNARMLERVRARSSSEWQIINACAASRDGEAMFSTGRQNLSLIASDGDFAVKTVDVFPFIADADLVKVNIEGSEWEILSDPRMADTAAVWILEYHDIRSPEPEIAKLAHDLFARAGYQTQVAMSHPTTGLLWAWRPAAA